MQNQLNISSKSLVQQPLVTPTFQNRVQRNQSFHGFQNRFNPQFRHSTPGTFQNLNFGFTNQIYANNFTSTSSMGPLILSNSRLSFQQAKSTENINKNNLQFHQNYGNPFSSTSSIRPLILSANSSRMSLNRAKSTDTINKNTPQVHPLLSPPRQYFTPLGFGQGPVTFQQPRLPLFNVQNIPRPSFPRMITQVRPPPPAPPKRDLTPKEIEKPDIKTAEIHRATDNKIKCPKKFGTLEYRSHKCNSPIFYSVRCRKHGKKRTIFELYALPLKQKNKVGVADQKKEDTKNEESNCKIVGEKTKEEIYENLTDSIQILEQTENETKQKPKPAPRCKRSKNNIYQNISYILKSDLEKFDNKHSLVKLDSSKKTSSSEEASLLENERTNTSLTSETSSERDQSTDSGAGVATGTDPLNYPVPIKPDVTPQVVPKMPLLDNKWSNSINKVCFYFYFYFI